MAQQDSKQETWRCPGCWERWAITQDCPNCGPGSRGIGLYRHPPVNAAGEISAGDDAFCMGGMRHCDVPEPFRRMDCTAVMDDHGWIDNGEDGITICPPDGIGYRKMGAFERIFG